MRKVHNILKQHFVLNQSGVRLCLHQLPAKGKPVGTVILAHGMFSNYRTCRGLAQYLSDCGYHCWLPDTQGHGHSDAAATVVDYETMCLDDTGAVLDFFDSDRGSQLPEAGQGPDECKSSDDCKDPDECKRREGSPLWWVGHSGGGLAIAMYLARYPDRQRLLSGIVTMASQATDAGSSRQRRLTLRVARWLLKFTGVVPGKLLRLGPENESACAMDQWLGWSLTGHWSGADNFDYSRKLSAVHLPSLSIAALADRYIAPVSGCERLHSWLGGEDKTFKVFGKHQGYREDYTHARIVSSRNASVDVWPFVRQWINDRS